MKCRRLVLIGGLMSLMGGLGLGCAEDNALLLTLQAESFVDRFDLIVRDVGSEGREIVLNRKDELVDPDNPNRDISQLDQALKISIEFLHPGHYLFYIMGRNATGTKQVALRDFEIAGVREETVKLKTVTDDIDQDDDGFPSCKAFTNCSIVDSALSCFFLDCNDLDAAINPFADEVCGNGKDDDCSAGCDADPKLGDATCVDNDHDGVPTPQDCDDDDPCRSPKIKEAAKICPPMKASDFVLPDACLKKLQAEGKTPPAPPFCGDGVDQSCSGGDATCVVDEDCDDFSPPQDCDDKEATINPKATEKCDGLDNNCNKIIDEGCLPCDVDGDGHALPGATDPNCKLPKDDPDDFDAGRFPGSTAQIGGKEGGTVAGALRGWCRSTKNKNGTPERDIDHDENGSPASLDCPKVRCDADGDGFARSDPGQGCTPSKPDCDDDDETVFPGAPDKCGDGKAQDCHADKPCVGDKDGDGYLGAPPGTKKNDLWQYDCNDNDAKIHPWATEICDRQDNDCDGLVDEGNPDGFGNLMSTAQKTCTDDGDGPCGKKPGTCACSALKPRVVGVRDAATRTACSGEDLNADASLRCFGAGQQAPELCDTTDHDCDGDPATGTNQALVDIGKPCSVNVGECKQGKVTGCDLSKTLPNASRLAAVHQAKGLDFNPHWTCSADTRFPAAVERCNGKDDVCDGSTSGETDGDKDGYLDCSGPCPVSDLAAGLKGCRDCRPGDGAVNPGATELCNGRDDNCFQGISDDGAGECSWSTPVCCAFASPHCVNTTKDAKNCGSCGKTCTGSLVDRCAGGKCVCGTSGASCPANLNCVSGVCRCIPHGNCPGCCDGYTCRAGGSGSACGEQGAVCKNCSDNDPCTQDLCNASHQCTNPNASNVTTSCSSGVCIGGVCCTTCRSNNSTCVTSLTTGQCGARGEPCKNCDDANACTTDSCSGGACHHSNVANNLNCPSGKCVSGSCCRGCVNGTTCVASPNTAHCGAAGSPCQTCRASNECKVPQCTGGGACTEANKTEGASCASGAGQCHKGICCTGCWDGSSCQTGTSLGVCGGAGGPCQNCDDGNVCTDDACTSHRCENTANTASCPGGTCHAKDCCKGCWGGNTCQNGDQAAACGTGGRACVACTFPNPACKANGTCGL